MPCGCWGRDGFGCGLGDGDGIGVTSLITTSFWFVKPHPIPNTHPHKLGFDPTSIPDPINEGCTPAARECLVSGVNGVNEVSVLASLMSLRS